MLLPILLFCRNSVKSCEAATRGVLCKKVFLEILQNSQENTCAGVSFLIKLQASKPATLLKKRLWRRCFPVNFVKFLRTAFLTENVRTTASKNDSLFYHFTFCIYHLGYLFQYYFMIFHCI